MKSKDNAGKGSKGKRARVVETRMTNTYCPEGISPDKWQTALRKKAAQSEHFGISQVEDGGFRGEYRVENPLTGTAYKVVYRGAGSPWNYCSCMDFKTSGLGTCKHIEAVKLWASNNSKKIYTKEPSYTSVFIDYRGGRKIRIRIGDDKREEFEKLAAKYFKKSGEIRETTIQKFEKFIVEARRIDNGFRCYDDALDYVIEKREIVSRGKMMERYTDEVLDSVLSTKLYPYQKEGVRFAIKAGKAIIADEMGLGKTVQAIEAAEIYLREGLAEDVMIVCPNTLKYQWKREIEKFTGGCRVDGVPSDNESLVPKVIIIEGNPVKRKLMYESPSPYKIVSYHTLANDVKQLGKIKCDLLIMDEIQRLKNWNTLISKAARKIESHYSVLLSGTPLENKLEELFATMELVDQFHLGPYYLFRDRHIILNPATGAVEGYKNLNSIGQQISDKLIRRTKKGVMLQLPKRRDDYILVPMSGAQADLHSDFRGEVAKILSKYKKYHFMTEKDRRKLLMLLSQMRMVADSTFILDPDLSRRSDVKIDELMHILDNTFENGDEKVVIFSEWERMTRLVAIELEKRGIRFEYLNGSIPAKQRGEIVNNFTTIPESRVFISTDAGSTGLNLQVASMLVNLDLPWNPAILEQRIARIYRLGQEHPVQIINLVSKDSIEEGMINKLKFKTSMFEGVLDGGADTVFVDKDRFKHFMEELSQVISTTAEAPQIEYVDVEDSAATYIDDSQTLDPDPINDDECSAAPSTEAGLASEAEHTTETRQATGSNLETVPSQPTDSSSETSVDDSVTADAVYSIDKDSSDTPERLINQGVAFFNGLTKTLSSPQMTRSLVDSIVEVDDRTGKANIKIPVESKDSVLQLFSLVGKLLQSSGK